MQADQLIKEMEDTANIIFITLSFIKEMSPQSGEDHRYIFEREWRIITGLSLDGQSLPYRALTQDEAIRSPAETRRAFHAALAVGGFSLRQCGRHAAFESADGRGELETRARRPYGAGMGTCAKPYHTIPNLTGPDHATPRHTGLRRTQP